MRGNKTLTFCGEAEIFVYQGCNMRSVVIHVGFHKAASTYLQENVFPQAQANYLFLAGDKRRILDMVQSAGQFDQKALEDWINKEIKEKYGKAPHDLTILSHEELSGHPHGYKTVDPFVAATNLKQAFSSAKIIMIIRNQFNYLLSIYTYRVAIKGQESRSLGKFLCEEGNSGLFDKLEYDKIIEHYMHLFGKQNVLVLPVELLKTGPEAFVKTITEFMDVPPISLKVDSPVNESTKLSLVIRFWRPINLIFASFLHTLHFLHIEFEEEYPYLWLRYKFYFIKRKITYLLNGLFQSTREISIERYSKYDELLARYSASNLRLQKLIDFSLREYDYPIEKNRAGFAKSS